MNIIISKNNNRQNKKYKDFLFFFFYFRMKIFYLNAYTLFDRLIIFIYIYILLL